MEGKSQKVFPIWSHSQKIKPNHCPQLLSFYLRTKVEKYRESDLVNCFLRRGIENTFWSLWTTPLLTYYCVQITGLKNQASKYHVTLSQENGLSSEWQTETCFLKFPFVEKDLSHSSHLNSVIFKCTDFSWKCMAPFQPKLLPQCWQTNFFSLCTLISWFLKVFKDY